MDAIKNVLRLGSHSNGCLRAVQINSRSLGPVEIEIIIEIITRPDDWRTVSRTKKSHGLVLYYSIAIASLTFTLWASFTS
jgi:hypothetical protein